MTPLARGRFRCNSTNRVFKRKAAITYRRGSLKALNTAKTLTKVREVASTRRPELQQEVFVRTINRYGAISCPRMMCDEVHRQVSHGDRIRCRCGTMLQASLPIVEPHYKGSMGFWSECYYCDHLNRDRKLGAIQNCNACDGPYITKT